MSNPLQELYEVRDRVVGVLAGLLLVLVSGMCGYRLIEHWSLFDSVYMTVITLATVGYGETHALSDAGRLFTIFLILGGIGVMTYAFSTITAIIVEGELSAAFRRRRMQKSIDKLQGHYIVCGGGHAGGVIAGELKKTGRPFVVLEKDKDTLEKMAERLGEEGFLGMVGDATEDEALKHAGIERAAGVFAVLAHDQDNAFVALSAKGLNPKVRVVSCQKELGVREKLFRSGADNVVNPEFIGGMRMASEMIRPATTGFLDAMLREKGSNVRFDEVNINEGSPFIGKTIKDVKDKRGHGALIVAVQIGHLQYDINPLDDRTLKAGERLVVIADGEAIKSLRAKAGS
jgi:voltage-gated potassium channel